MMPHCGRLFLAMIPLLLICRAQAFQGPFGIRAHSISKTLLWGEKKVKTQLMDPAKVKDTSQDNQDGSFIELMRIALPATAAATTLATTSSSSALAKPMDLGSLSSVNMTPETFQPVCSASDGFYRFLQQTSVSLIGPENYDQYKPLIAGGLLRVRLELCVVESFLNEAVVPFIRDNGLSWVLPLHETVETFIAGVVFAFATTFVFIGSTKILTIIITYTDFLFGLPARLLGGFTFDRAQNKPVTFDIGFGRFKTRVIGPSEEKISEMEPLDITKESIPTVVVLFLSGAVNYFGKGLGVSDGIRYQLSSRLLIAPLRSSSCGSFWRQLMLSLAVIWFCGPVYT